MVLGGVGGSLSESSSDSESRRDFLRDLSSRFLLFLGGGLLSLESEELFGGGICLAGVFLAAFLLLVALLDLEARSRAIAMGDFMVKANWVVE